MEFKENHGSDLIFLELTGPVHNQRVEVFSQGEMMYFDTKVDCVFLMYVS